MLAGLVRLAIFFLLIYLAYLVVRVYRSLTRPRRPSRRREIQGVMVKDEVCNTYIPMDDAIREVRDGQERFFCSEDCRRKSRAVWADLRGQPDLRKTRSGNPETRP